MQESKKRLERCLPCVQITTKDVISFCNERSQKPSPKDAKQWLLDNKRTIEREMRSAIREEIASIFDFVLFGGYVDPALNEQYQDFYLAVNAAMDDYAAKNCMELHEFSCDECHISELVELLLANPVDFRACVEYDTGFCLSGVAPTEENIRRCNRVHLIREQGQLTAEVIDTDTCAHNGHVIVPSA